MLTVIDVILIILFDTMSSHKICCALIQMQVGFDKEINLLNASKLISDAKNGGARLVTLPECFNSPYGINYFKYYAEHIPNGPTCKMLSNAAKINSIYLVGGTLPEVDGENIYNTCTVWNPEGELISKFRKMHLFDIDIPGKIAFRESDSINPGNTISTFCLDGTKVGLGICHDLRFEEMAKLYKIQNCKLIIYPGAFEMNTGAMHWELLQRIRALDNQVYVFGVSPARSDKDYIAWGHSQVTDPWGKVIAQTGYNEELLFCNIDLTECDKVEQELSVFSQRRLDLYGTILNN